MPIVGEVYRENALVEAVEESAILAEWSERMSGWNKAARMPALFVGHGSPMNAIEDNEFRRKWEDVGRAIQKPAAILCISAHWETRGVSVTASERPATIHDFYGFPGALFEVRYPAPGAPALATRTAELLAPIRVRQDGSRGLDHGCWSVLSAMYPKADIPVAQLSLDTARPGAFHFDLSKTLFPLREEGVLILGSGNLVHNLGAIDFARSGGYDWAIRFDAEVKKRIAAGDSGALAEYESLSPDASLAIPTPEHYLPLLYVLALRRGEESVVFFNDKVVMGSISMTSVAVGENGL